MVIVSKNKVTVLNFDNVNLIGITRDGEVKVRLGIEDNVVLGKYTTEERAKEVLQEIISKYKEYATISNALGSDIRGIYNIPKVYEMPKE